jgi:formylglycine-generating enzyme required for sulfatase activity
MSHPAVRRDAPSERVAGDGMVLIAGGRFRMGSDRHYPEEAPAHDVTVAPFLIDMYPVTNRRFAEFVEDTRYVTVAERCLSAGAKSGPSARPLPGAFVFTASDTPQQTDRERWWFYMPGAHWRRPENGESVFQHRLDHPVTCVTYEDAAAYARWAGKSLPTEAQWEFAARGGLAEAEFAWGHELAPNGKRMANIWSGGPFPCDPARPFPAFRTSRVGKFPANGYGLYDMIGNVWEWTADRFGLFRTPSANAFASFAGDETESSADDCVTIARVVKGGSFLSAPDYSARYRPAARQSLMADTAGVDVGFRCVIPIASNTRGLRF